MQGLLVLLGTVSTRLSAALWVHVFVQHACLQSLSLIPRTLVVVVVVVLEDR